MRRARPSNAATFARGGSAVLDDLENTPSWEWPADAKPRLLSALASDAPAAQRALAASLLSEVSDDEVAETLLARILDANEDADVRSAAAVAVGPALEVCDIEGFDEDFSEPPLSQGVFDKIATALERVYRDGAAPVLTRRAALEAAVRAPRDWQTAAVRAAWATDDPSWRLTAVFCAGYVPGLEAVVGEAIATGDPQLVQTAVRSAANGMSAVVKIAERTVLEFAASESAPREVRLDAIEALASLESPESMELLSQLTESSDDDIADVAQEALALRGLSEDDDDDLDW
jgi:hypothetical protein